MLQANNILPVFVSGYINLAANPSTCGGLTIKPKSGALVKLESYKVESNTDAKTLLGSYDNGGNGLEVDGHRFRYDSGGQGGYYRIYCKSKKNDKWSNANCSEVVTMENIRHNTACLPGNAGPGVGDEGYTGLKMNQG